ncbi:MAG: sugar phosphate isomerase/epimerase [Clostridiales bacterium]|jgi:sugar phosphate isomerase/epimerase|nr:sugar phosphate isomerase/epimerase [Clostridiales bacterium]
MELAISTACYFSKLFTEQSFVEVKKLGLTTCEVFLATFYEYESSFAEILKRESRGLKVYSVHALTNQFEPELFNLSPRTRADAERLFDKVVSSGRTLGAKYYTFHGPTRLKKKAYKFDFEKLGERFCQLNERAMAQGVRMAYENVNWTFFSEPDYWANLKRYCPGLNTVLDIKQAMQSRIDYIAFLDVMEGSLANVHICDWDENGRLCMPGRGVFDFKGLFKRLEDIGYGGPVTLEIYADAYKDFSEIKECTDYLLSLYPFTTCGSA